MLVSGSRSNNRIASLTLEGRGSVQRCCLELKHSEVCSDGARGSSSAQRSSGPPWSVHKDRRRCRGSTQEALHPAETGTATRVWVSTWRRQSEVSPFARSPARHRPAGCGAAADVVECPGCRLVVCGCQGAASRWACKHGAAQCASLLCRGSAHCSAALQLAQATTSKRGRASLWKFGRRVGWAEQQICRLQVVWAGAQAAHNAAAARVCGHSVQPQPECRAVAVCWCAPPVWPVSLLGTLDGELYSPPPPPVQARMKKKWRSPSTPSAWRACCAKKCRLGASPGGLAGQQCSMSTNLPWLAASGSWCKRSRAWTRRRTGRW